MSVLVVGALGNMGRRYTAILKHLGKEALKIDVENSERELMACARQADGIIIATPTDTHAEFIHKLSHLKKPILCEKPITKDIHELKSLMMRLRTDRTPFRMIYQYSLLANDSFGKHSYFNFYKHGNDGLAWDCTQIIGLANGPVEIHEDSPIWRCAINGQMIDIAQMDFAYVRYVRDWFRDPRQDLEEIEVIHQKVNAYEARHGKR